VTVDDLIPEHQNSLARILSQDWSEPLQKLAKSKVLQGDVPRPVVNLKAGYKGKYEIHDGFYRIAGMILAGETRFPVLRAIDEDHAKEVAESQEIPFAW